MARRVKLKDQSGGFYDAEIGWGISLDEMKDLPENIPHGGTTERWLNSGGLIDHPAEPVEIIEEAPELEPKPDESPADEPRAEEPPAEPAPEAVKAPDLVKPEPPKPARRGRPKKKTA